MMMQIVLLTISSLLDVFVEVCVYYYESSPSPINNRGLMLLICMNPQNYIVLLDRVDRIGLVGVFVTLVVM